jgi:hypothetical protein
MGDSCGGLFLPGEARQSADSALALDPATHNWDTTAFCAFLS